MAERRPLKSRDTAMAARVARWLSDRAISPNAISQISVAFAGLAGLAFWGSGSADGVLRWVLLALAAAGCQLRLACNLLDGMVAVEGGKGGPDGPFWNEVPDRVADVAILVGLGLGAGDPSLGWAAATTAVAVAYVRELGAAQGLPADFSGPMAKPHRMALATAMALVAIFWPAVLIWGLWVLVLGSAMTFLRRSVRVIAALNARG